MMSIIASHIKYFEIWKNFILLHLESAYHDKIEYNPSYTQTLRIHGMEYYKYKKLSYPTESIEYLSNIYGLDKLSLKYHNDLISIEIQTSSKYKEISYINTFLQFTKNGNNEDNYELISYYPNGNIMERGFVFYVKVDEWISYKENGTIDQMIEYDKNGKIKSRTFY